MQPPFHIRLLRSISVGSGVGLLLWLIGLSPYQSFMVGAWFAMASTYFQNLQYQEKRKDLALVSYIGVLFFYLFGFVTRAFGYELDYRLFIGGFAVLIIFLLIAQYIKQRPLRITLYTVLMVGVIGYGAATFSRCSFIPCQPASWAKQETIIKQILSTSGKRWRIEAISVEPRSENLFWFTEQPNLEVRVFARRVDSNDNTSQRGNIASFSYNDIDPQRTLIIEDDFGAITFEPMIEEESFLPEIRVSPRDVLNITRVMGQQFLGRTPEYYELDIEIELGEDAFSDFEAKYVWKTTYTNLDEDKQLRFWIDATTGTILRTQEILH